MRNRLLLIAPLCAVVAGCSSADTVTARNSLADHAIEGAWGQPLTFPGNSFTVSLTESSGVVTGTGSFAGEAGPFGSLAVSGSIANKQTQLRIIYHYDPQTFPTLAPDTAQFTGTLIAADTIDGQLTRRGQTSAMQLVRLRIGDPQ